MKHEELIYKSNWLRGDKGWGGVTILEHPCSPPRNSSRTVQIKITVLERFCEFSLKTASPRKKYSEIKRLSFSGNTPRHHELSREGTVDLFSNQVVVCFSFNFNSSTAHHHERSPGGTVGLIYFPMFVTKTAGHHHGRNTENRVTLFKTTYPS